MFTHFIFSQFFTDWLPGSVFRPSGMISPPPFQFPLTKPNISPRGPVPLLSFGFIESVNPRTHFHLSAPAYQLLLGHALWTCLTGEIFVRPSPYPLLCRRLCSNRPSPIRFPDTFSPPLPSSTSFHVHRPVSRAITTSSATGVHQISYRSEC
ncbi:hypothetical protein DFH09DRAFT_1373795 [Mycena vulgaris]|nr:hypothetical protein DFH09DRAFT_1373795 [Mycena vulgaris]